jgi:hypothetical protein
MNDVVSPGIPSCLVSACFDKKLGRLVMPDGKGNKQWCISIISRREIQ